MHHFRAFSTLEQNPAPKPNPCPPAGNVSRSAVLELLSRDGNYLIDMDQHNHEESIFRRKFPLGYFLHYDPYNFILSSNYDSSPPSCGQILFIFELLSIFIRSHKSYLKTDATGLLLYWHPDQTLKVKWEEVLRLERRRIFSMFPCDELFVDHPVFLGEHKHIYLTKKTEEYFEQKKFSIPLHLYVGWPNGKLEAELMKFIPKIVSKKARS